MIRILNVVGPLTYGGIESLLLSYAIEIDRNEYIYDFLTCSEEESEIERKIINTGSKVKHIVRRRKNPLLHVIQLFDYLRKNKKNYDIIHVHMSEESFLPLFIAKICGYKIRIAHSHTSFINNKISWIMKIKIYLTNVFATNYVGCSISACEFLYPNKNNAIVLNNCINYSNFFFNCGKRDAYRQEFGLEGETALVLVGRLNPEKNHLFLCNLLSDERLKNCKLFFVGEGVTRKQIEQEIKRNGLSEKVFLLGNRNDVKDILSAFDIFVMPSIHEGFPIVLLEAQINGLHCIVSENISKETDISGNISYLALNSEVWIEQICNIQKNITCREYKGTDRYDIKTCLDALIQYYKKILDIKY